VVGSNLSSLRSNFKSQISDYILAYPDLESAICNLKFQRSEELLLVVPFLG
jgi:hypothetical protein